MKSQTLAANWSKTICWRDETIIDYSEGIIYSLDEATARCQKYSYGWGDSAINSANGEYAFTYKKLSTKGLLFKNGNLLREINRTYYYSGSYEYPAAFLTIENKTYLVHCPIEYKRLDFEDVETGEIITDIPNRKPDDFFHSRLEVSPDGTYLMSKGWAWHPVDRIAVFNINDCLNNPLLLDDVKFYPDVRAEICTASFINDSTVLIGSSAEPIDLWDEDDDIGHLPPEHICVWDLKTDRLSKPVEVKEKFGNLFAISANFTWDMFKFPKIIDINTGEVIAQNKEISSGNQQSSMIGGDSHYPSIIFNRSTGKIAVKAKDKIEVLTPDLAFINL